MAFDYCQVSVEAQVPKLLPLYSLLLASCGSSSCPLGLAGAYLWEALECLDTVPAMASTDIMRDRVAYPCPSVVRF